MLEPPTDEHTLRALINLRSDEDFGTVLKWLSKALEDERDLLCALSSKEDLHRSQGVAQALKCMLGAPAHARSALDKLRAKAAGKRTGIHTEHRTRRLG